MTSSRPIAGGIDLNHVVKVLFAKFLQCKVSILPFHTVF